ncbi:Alpha-amylase A type-3 [Pleurostoma richardsiae]|uniref:alpha-amylase n=1 Tax=Pleurostoma richardsiae TaxID=41990 RepID=A0AA38RT30_9PEZI|nr:Alpha-amylase A type-3 [Pleurostoma richardsiae]
MRLLATLALLLAAVAAPVRGLTPAEWRGQSIYQVMTDRFARTDLSTTATCDTGAQAYCGGTWQGLISKLDYIQGMGFTAIWISPMVKQMDGQTSDGSSYHGYWAQDIYDVNSAFGTSDDLVALSEALHARGMYLMLDVVTNHMAYNGCGTCVDYSQFDPFSSQSSYFHSFCLIDYNNYTSIQVCWEGDNTVSLPDLRTEDSDVRSVWNSWITDIVSKYSIDGLRVDSAQQVETSFFPPFESAAGVYIVGEVFNGDPSYVTPFQQYMSGLLNYPAYFWITQAFESTSGSISNLVNGINTMKSSALNTSLYGSFLENHDNKRFAALTSDLALARNAIAFTMLMDGIPIVYQGQEQHYSGGDVPYNREALWLSGYATDSSSAPLYGWIKTLNAIRSAAVASDSSYLSYQAWPIYSDTHTIAMRKGAVVSVYTNVGGSGSAYSVALPAASTGFSAGEALTDVMSCAAFTADSSGGLSVSLSAGAPLVLYPTSLLSGTGICSSSGGASSSAASKTATATATGTATATACATGTSVAITFNELVTTTYGTTVKIVGNTGVLGSWDTSKAVALSASQYTSSNPLWSGTVSGLTSKSVVEYKFIKVDSSGTVTWEADPNHTLTVPCAAATVSSSWQS